jgi:hypothetical protein
LAEKLVEVTVEAREVEGGEVGESTEDKRKKRENLMGHCERESKTVGDGEELFGDDRERFHTTIVVDKESDDMFPTLIRQI